MAKELSKLAWVGAAGAVALLTAAPAWASGFAIMEQSAKGLGRAFAGSAAAADDASTVFFNPAGMTYLGTEAMAALHVVVLDTVFTDQGTTISPLLGGAPLSGPAKTSANSPIFIPNMYAVWAVTDDVRFGVGVNSPFGLTTEYGKGWPGRYQALKSDLLTLNVNPSLAYRVTDWLSVGAGFSYQYVEAELTNAIDFGSACLGSLPAGTCAGLGLLPQLADGEVRVEGNDSSFGWNVGVMLEPLAGTRVGLHYRSKIKHELEGRAFFTVPANAAILTATGAFQSAPATAGVTLPETASVSLRQEVTKHVTALADASWTHWSRFEFLTIQIQNPANQTSTQRQDWNNTWRLSAGGEYDSLEKWALRAGVAWDQSPVRTETRAPRIPDADRWWMSLGGTFRWTDALSFDLGYTHMWVANGRLDQTGATGDRLVGTYKNSSVDMVSFQANYRF